MAMSLRCLHLFPRLSKQSESFRGHGMKALWGMSPGLNTVVSLAVGAVERGGL